MDARIEAEAVALRRRADRNAHGHIAQALRLRTLNDVATFVATIGGAAVMSASAVIIGSPRPIQAVEVALAGIGGIITLVGVWQAVWDPGGRSLAHKRWATRFAVIEDECRRLLCGDVEKGLGELMHDFMLAADEADLVAERYWRRIGRTTKTPLGGHPDAGRP